ncbi:toxin-activating lysine-acyltransferase [Microvirga sp. SRT01]|uniref:RTX toxin-activating lysine-acyltransferase n=1 Tax=Sphingomonas longa TaxID=2778730 RepID=A0ABS2D7V7_9SPHN|nr:MULTISPECIES: toxin-activating lysine-acyltransferase [Alphaproteobacteria]MBM6577027.1 toxin-activating lysine-acyltransferase [Sphingomonas sp. BT552]MBR7710071.1 toxin-activating lysine-acyltransferase [Microvirga sp. SRT01]
MDCNGAPATVAEALGQVTWLFSQSPAHKQLKIADLEWSVMPALLHEQFRVFRFGPLPGLDHIDPHAFPPGMGRAGLEQMPLGVALWGWLSEAAEAKVEQGVQLESADWNSGDRLWLLELISPFATSENKLAEIMLADLISGPFAGERFSLHRIDPTTGRKDKVTVHGTSGPVV